MKLLFSKKQQQQKTLYHNVFSCKRKRKKEESRKKGRMGKRRKQKKVHFKPAWNVSQRFRTSLSLAFWGSIFILSVAPPCGCKRVANSLSNNPVSSVAKERHVQKSLNIFCSKVRNSLLQNHLPKFFSCFIGLNR